MNVAPVGFVINIEKRTFNPKTKGKWLRTIIGTIEMTFTVPSGNINKLLAGIKNILTTGKNNRATFIYALRNRISGESFYEEHVSSNRKYNFLVLT